MMVLSALRPDASLPEFLAHRARSASVRRLAADLLIGSAAIAGALWWMPTAWLWLSGAGLAFASYGAWGLADRAQLQAFSAESAFWRAALRVICTLTTASGGLAVAVLLYCAWALALGTWIS